MNVAIRRKMARVIASRRLRDARLSLSRLGRRLSDRATVHYFHQVDDPYSHLTAQVLTALMRRYQISLTTHLVPPPSDSAAPERERLAAWARRDAAILAQHYDLEAPQRSGGLGEVFDEQPRPELIALATQALTSAIVQDRFEQLAPAIGNALWQGKAVQLAEYAHNTDPGAPAAALRLGGRKQQRLGHYLGATFYFGGEWFWGLDRLHYLEEQLRIEGLANAPQQPLIAPPPELQMALCPPPAPDRPVPQLHFWGSLRSPYTYIGLERARVLAAHYGAQLQLHFVLPMAMRGLPVPAAKRIYIVRDAKREADRLGIAFGKITDPVGAPAERGLAVLHHAIRQGLGLEFALSFLRGVWSEGIHAGSDRGLNLIASRVGIDAPTVQAALADDSWRQAVRENRDELLSLGMWGVPSMRVDHGPAYWGQDRLWLIEQDLIAAGR